MFTRSGRRDGKKEISNIAAENAEDEIIIGNFPYISMDSEIHRSNEPNYPAIGEKPAEEQEKVLFALPGGSLW